MVNSNNKNGVALIGFMGTGKTTVGLELSKKLKRELINVDLYIEDETNMSIAEIFKRHGEGYFRKIESDAIEEIKREIGILIDCGGGVCLKFDNIENLRENNKIILLEASSENIFKRLENDTTRPLLSKNMSIEYINKLLEERKKSYHLAADLIINTDYKTVEEIVEEILENLSFLKKNRSD